MCVCPGADDIQFIFFNRKSSWRYLSRQCDIVQPCGWACDWCLGYGVGSELQHVFIHCGQHGVIWTWVHFLLYPNVKYNIQTISTCGEWSWNNILLGFKSSLCFFFQYWRCSQQCLSLWVLTSVPPSPTPLWLWCRPGIVMSSAGRYHMPDL